MSAPRKSPCFKLTASTGSRRAWALAIAFATAVASAGSAEPSRIIPLPASIQPAPGTFTLTTDTAIVSDTSSSTTAGQLAAYLQPATGLALPISATRPPNAKTAIVLTQDASLGRLGPEGYRLTVTPEEIQISASDQAGLFFGIQTLRQLFPPQVFGGKFAGEVKWSVPGTTIEDRPRLAWRGLMLDSGHDFQNKAYVLRFIDLMALHKFNVFHWHLTDLGTWSIEIKNHPKLLDPSTRGPGVKPGHYTQDEIREVIRYATQRHITIVPEIDMPGHEPPALIAYPELDCPIPRTDKNGKPTRPWEFCVGNEKTYAFLEDVLAQVIELFPSRYIHIGGDECPKDRWNRCPVCQEKMTAEHLKNGEELQSYFVRRIEAFLQSKNRRLIGWDEILQGGLAPNATVMSWRGMGGGIAAAKAEHDVVMAPTEWTYFDYPNTSVEKVYSFEPVPKDLNAGQQKHILGAQAQMWTDHHPTENEIDGLVYPRAAALAEVVWSPAASRDFGDFSARLRTHLPRLAALGVHYTPTSPDGILLGRWTPGQTSPTPKAVEWPITAGITGQGTYDITFWYEHGKSRLDIHAVEIPQDGKSIATDKHSGLTGAQHLDNVYHLQIPALSGGGLTLRATISTDAGPESYGKILIGKAE